MPFASRQAFHHLAALAKQVGIRPGGSPAERRASKYVLNHFRSLGLEASVEPFDVEIPGKTESECTIEGLGRVASRPVAATANTPARGLSGPLVFVETGEEVHLPEFRPGQIFLLYGELGPPEKYAPLMRAKPAAIILAENLRFIEPRLTKLSHEKREAFGAVPTLRIGFADADRALRKRAKRARVTVSVSHEWRRSQNVWGVLRGSEKPWEIVTVGGHYDSVWAGYGAQDNAGGAAVVMELARVFARAGSKRTIRFCTFGCEELGLRGSTAHVENLRKAHARHKPDRKKWGWKLDESPLEQHRLMLNVDLQGLLMGENYCPVGGPPELVAACKLLSSEMGPSFKFDEECYSSDNAPFAHAGIPTAAFGRLGVELMWAHTPADTLDRCWEESLQPIGEYLEEFLTRYVARAKAFPFRREIPEAHKKKVEEYFRGRVFGYVDG
ncbi:MAG: M20/M25/M40 family metallo-hydrolase [Planctomycetes bacterium]|nr:M20/M25/M40 family metallo-hydrolase [Planctomycetota bacterium]